MELDEAIKHCLEVAEDNETKARRIGQQYEGTLLDRDAKECRRCAAEHRQFAEWLTELKQWRRVYGICPSYEMCIPESKGGYNARIAEYKRLLKEVLADLAEAEHCGLCKYEADDIATCQRKPINCFVWRYADEALKLLND